MDTEQHEALNERLREVAQVAQSVHGFVNEHAGALLYQFARFFTPVPTVVELGSWRGRSTIWLAAGLLDRGEGQVHAVDTWKGTPHEPEHQSLLAEYGPDDLFNEFWGNMMSAGLADWVEPIRASTLEAARGWPACSIQSGSIHLIISAGQNSRSGRWSNMSRRSLTLGS